MSGVSGVSGVGGIGYGAYDAPLTADSLILSRDGIVGGWKLPGTSPKELPSEGGTGTGWSEQLKRLSPTVRANLFDFELHSRLGFGVGADGAMEVWHLATSPGSGTTRPNATYALLVSMKRPKKEIFEDQLDYIGHYADLRADRAAEILAQTVPAIAFLSSISFVTPDRTPKTLELIWTALRFAHLVNMRLKAALACKRPVEFSPQVQPMILTPTHGALPSGHAAEAFTAAFVLWKLLNASGAEPYVGQKANWGEQFMRLAARIAINRTVAGLHFPVDSAAGCMLGLTLGAYLVARCTADDRDPAATPAAPYRPFRFHGNDYPLRADAPSHDADFRWDRFIKVNSDKDEQTDVSPYVEVLSEEDLGANGSAILRWLWKEAVDEWRTP